MKRLRLSFPKPLPPADQIALCLRAQTGDEKARQTLVLTNWGFLYRHAQRFARQTSLLDIDDLMHIGALALFHAIDLFDPSHGVRFITYATYWVDHDMRQAVVQSAIRLSAPLEILTRVWSNRYGRAREKLEASGVHGDDVDSAVAKAHGMTRTLLRDAENLRQTTPFMDQVVDEAHTRTLHDLLPASGVSVEDRLSEEDWNAHLHTTIALLGSKMPFTCRVILSERILAGRTLLDVGNDLNISRERVRQIETSILKELRDALRRAFPDELGAK